MKHRQKARKHRNRGKRVFKDIWGFKKNFARDYYDREDFNKKKYLFYR